MTTLDEVGLLKFGHTIQLAGAVYTGEGGIYIVPLPDEQQLVSELDDDPSQLQLVKMDQSDWVALLQQTDLLETQILQQAEHGGFVKAIIRKSTRQIEQGVSWRVFKRDGYRCRYCAADDVPLTVDHLVTWESGGPSIEENLVSACRRCNKTRGELPYEEWLQHKHYKRQSVNLEPHVRVQNEDLQRTLDKIPRRVHQRSR